PAQKLHLGESPMKNSKPALLALAVALALAGCGKEAPKPSAGQAPGAASAAEVKIGPVGPLTGGIPHLGKDNENGARLAVEEANAAGIKIDGKDVKFTFVAEDDQADPKVGTTVAQKLVDAKVAGVVGHLNSGTSIPASKIYSDAGIPQISPSATNPKLTLQGFKTTFRVMANDVQQGSVIGKAAVETLGVKEMEQSGIKCQYIAGDGVCSAEWPKLAGGAAEGQYCTQAGLPPDKMPNAKDFVTRFTAKYGPIQVYAPYSYDAAMTLIEAMKKANSPDPAKYLPELAKISYNGITAKIEFDEHGDTKNGAITLYQVKDGKLMPMAVNVGGKTEKLAAAAPAGAAAPAPAEPMKKDEMMKGEMKKGEMKKDEKKK